MSRVQVSSLTRIDDGSGGTARLPGLQVDDRLDVTVAGVPVSPRELLTDAGGRLHLAEIPNGRLVIDYAATVTGHADPAPVSDVERLTYLRPSRYAESDRLE